MDSTVYSVSPSESAELVFGKTRTVTVPRVLLYAAVAQLSYIPRLQSQNAPAQEAQIWSGVLWTETVGRVSAPLSFWSP